MRFTVASYWPTGDGDYANSTTVFNDDAFDFGVALKVQVLVLGTSCMNVCARGVRSAASIAIDPLEPMLRTMAESVLDE